MLAKVLQTNFPQLADFFTAYHTYDEYVAYLTNLTNVYSNVAKYPLDSKYIHLEFYDILLSLSLALEPPSKAETSPPWFSVPPLPPPGRFSSAGMLLFNFIDVVFVSPSIQWTTRQRMVLMFIVFLLSCFLCISRIAPATVTFIITQVWLLFVFFFLG